MFPCVFSSIELISFASRSNGGLTYTTAISWFRLPSFHSVVLHHLSILCFLVSFTFSNISWSPLRRSMFLWKLFVDECLIILTRHDYKLVGWYLSFGMIIKTVCCCNKCRISNDWTPTSMSKQHRKIVLCWE